MASNEAVPVFATRTAVLCPLSGPSPMRVLMPISLNYGDNGLQRLDMTVKYAEKYDMKL